MSMTEKEFPDQNNIESEDSMSLSQTDEELINEDSNSPTNDRSSENNELNETTIEQNDRDVHDEEQPQEDQQHKESKHKQIYESFLTELEQLKESDAKLEKAINFMESSLSLGGSPRFKNFWEARNLCLDLFKQNISSPLRTHLWAKYTDLSKEARRLKEILEEQSAFAAEQIEIAILALEKDSEQEAGAIHEKLFVEALLACRSLYKQHASYQKMQGELNFLNAQAARINALRKELIRTEMRIRIKNKFFQRLSVAGDKVFPHRKELIKALSQNFMEDIDHFIKHNFTNEDIYEPLFSLREEIKSLQKMAKLLTLNTHSFTQTRLCLSQCWDRIKEVEKERKKIKAQQKNFFKQNQETIQQKINELKTALQMHEIEENSSSEIEPLSPVEALKKMEEITTFMRQVELGREEVKLLRESLDTMRYAILDKQKAEEDKKNYQEQEREKQKKERQQKLRAECENLLQVEKSYTLEQLMAEREALTDKINAAPISKMEKQELERLLKPLRDSIAEKREKAVLDLSEDDRQKLNQLQTLLKEKKERRQEIKNQLKTHQKSSKGSSGLDFNQAMTINMQIADEEEHLEKINESIAEFEQMIKSIENLIK